MDVVELSIKILKKIANQVQEGPCAFSQENCEETPSSPENAERYHKLNIHMSVQKVFGYSAQKCGDPEQHMEGASESSTTGVQLSTSDSQLRLRTSTTQQPTCTNLRIRSVEDAHKVFLAIQKGALHMATRRLNASEHAALHTGFAYFTRSTVEQLGTIDSLPDARHLEVPAGMLVNARKHLGLFCLPSSDGGSFAQTSVLRTISNTLGCTAGSGPDAVDGDANGDEKQA
ncbi:hypothetical protein B0H14DRAFT_2619603 [Mycena olivaceomarginata]|nr:hypothetical protein B0H14DRAFT_2619603 [Mycena olivaceomarginata]